MNKINIKTHFPSLHQLGVIRGIACGTSSEDDVRKMAIVCEKELDRADQTRKVLSSLQSILNS
jgi:hypothetical protein